MTFEEKMAVVEAFHEGMDLYKAKNFSGALRAFEKALEIDPADTPSLLYVDRCKEFKSNPPPRDWDGVFVMKTK